MDECINSEERECEKENRENEDGARSNEQDEIRCEATVFEEDDEGSKSNNINFNFEDSIRSAEK
jgi:hypothetical protein